MTSVFAQQIVKKCPLLQIKMWMTSQIYFLFQSNISGKFSWRSDQ